MVSRMQAPRPDEGWDRVARRLDAELDIRGWSVNELVRRSGVNLRTIQKLLNGEPVTRRDRLTPLANAFGWRGDGWTIIRAGGEPVPEGGADDKPVQIPEVRAARIDAIDERLRRVEQMLQEILDAGRGAP
jgi:transcriptional regulator with XRE-family HTH domain